jgi:CO dehydrogenase maturation factor
MRIAVSGKGGAGKTTISGTLARLYAQQGRQVLAIDGDPNPNLAVTLGIPRETCNELEALPRSLMVDTVDAAGNKTRVLGRPTADIVTEYGVSAPDNVALLLGTKVDHPGKG